MAQKEFVFKINGEQAANTIAGIQEQIKKLDSTIANSNINDPNFGNLIKESETAKKSLRTLQTEGVEGLKPQGVMGSIKNFGKSLSEIPGPIGGVIGGINSMTAASLRFIATPVGAIIAALVVVFKAFQKGIESSEKAQMGLNKIMGAFTGIIGPVIKTIGEFAALLIDGVVAAIDAVTTALAALGIEFAQNAKDGMALAGTLNAIEEAEGDLEVARAQQNKTLAEARDLLSDTNAKYEDRKKALAEIKQSEESLAAKEVELAKKRVAAAKETIRLYGESKENLDALDAAMIKLSNTEESYFSKQRQFNKEQKKLDAEQAAKAKEAADKAKQYRDQRLAAQQADIALEQKIDLAYTKDKQQKELLALDQSTANQKAALKKQLADKVILRKEYDAQIKKLDELQALQEAEIYQKAKEAQKASNEANAKEYNKTREQELQSTIKAEQERISALKKASAEAYSIYRGSEMEIAAAKIKASLEQIRLEEQLQYNIQKIKDKFAQEDREKAFNELKTDQERRLLVVENAAKAEKYSVLTNKKATDAEKVAAEKKYAETIRAEQEKQIGEQKALLEAQNAEILKRQEEKAQAILKIEEKIKNSTQDLERVEYERQKANLEKALKDEEALHKKNNDEILKLQGQLVDNLATKYEEDKKNWAESWLEKNKTALEQLDGFLNAATSVISAISDFQKLKDQEDLEATKAKYNAQQTELDAKYAADIAAAQAAGQETTAIEDEYAFQSQVIEYNRADEEYKQGKAGFERNKGVQIAQAVIGTIQGAVQAFTSLAGIPIVGPVLGSIAAAAALASGYAQVALIRKSTYTGTPPKAPERKKAPTSGAGSEGGQPSPSKFADGGLLMGRKHAEGGVITSLGELEGGEFVVNRDATNKFLPTLQRINSMGSGSGAPNNLSSGAEARLGTNQPIIKTYVLASEISSQLEAQKKIADIARL